MLAQLLLFAPTPLRLPHRSPEAQRGPADWLLILDALLAAYGVVAVVPRQGLQGTLDHLKELALYAATAYLAAQGAC